MKTNKSYKEAILRAYSTEKDNTEAQEHLLALRQQTRGLSAQAYSEDTPVIETHKNLMRSWFNLRRLDQHLAEDTNNQKRLRKSK